MVRDLGGDEVVYDVLHLPSRLAEESVEVRLESEVVGIGETSVTLAGGERIDADVVVLALGREQAPTTLKDQLTATGLPVTVVGSAQRPGRIFDALHSAFFAGRLL